MCKECHGVEFIANGDKMFYNSFDELTQDLKDKFKSKAKGANLIRAKNGYVRIINELNKNGDILLNSFVSQSTKLKIKRTKCGHTTDVKFGNYQRQGCGLCGGSSKEFGKINFFKKLKENKDELIGEYIDSKTHVTIRWHECGHTTKITPSNYSRDEGCGICWKETLKSGDRLRELWQDEYFRQMQIQKNKEMWQNEEFRQAQSDRMREMINEKWQDEDFRNRMCDKAKEQWQDEEFRQMRSEKVKEQWENEEFRQKQSDKMKEQWKGEEYRQMQSEKAKERWQDEEMKRKMGYKGGITPILMHLRHLPVVSQWRKNTYIRENNRCQLTSKKVHGGNSDVHHLYGFNMIVLEAHKLHNIQVKPQVKDYTEGELHKLEEYVANWHKDTSNAVVLSEEVHILFHSLYGYGDNTPEQFEEFKQRYLNGEFKDLLGGDLND